jgi:mono/diheme cytochrome c family protein
MNRLALLALVAASCTGKYVRPTVTEPVNATAELVARGNYLVNSVSSCGACHTPRVGGSWLGGERTDAFLAGGAVMGPAPASRRRRSRGRRSIRSAAATPPTSRR